MSDLLLRTFQTLDRVHQLQNDGVLVADWKHVLPGTERAYARMVGCMAGRGIVTDGRPPMWAWRGVLRLRDAALLFDPDHQLSAGSASLTFKAPAKLVLLCDYSHWGEALMPSANVPLEAWRPRRRTAGSRQPEQACLPYLLADWVTKVKALPTSGWDTLDQEVLL